MKENSDKENDYRSRMLLDQVDDLKKIPTKPTNKNPQFNREVKMTGKFIILICLFLLSLTTFAQTKILLSTDQRDIAVGDIFSIQLIIDGETDAELRNRKSNYFRSKVKAHQVHINT